MGRFWPIFADRRSRSTMDSIRVSEALDSGSIPDETTILNNKPLIIRGFHIIKIYFQHFSGFTRFYHPGPRHQNVI